MILSGANYSPCQYRESRPQFHAGHVEVLGCQGQKRPCRRECAEVLATNFLLPAASAAFARAGGRWYWPAARRLSERAPSRVGACPCDASSRDRIRRASRNLRPARRIQARCREKPSRRRSIRRCPIRPAARVFVVRGHRRAGKSAPSRRMMGRLRTFCRGSARKRNSITRENRSRLQPKVSDLPEPLTAFPLWGYTQRIPARLRAPKHTVNPNPREIANGER